MSEPLPESKVDLEVTPNRKEDSFKLPVEKSPLFMYAILQIPLVLIMGLALYFMYQSTRS